MRRILQFFIATGLLLTAWLEGFGQNLSNRGKEFWVAYGHHQFMETGTNQQEMVLYFSAEQAANVTVRINNTTWVRNYSIPANTVIISDFIPKAGTDDCRMFEMAFPAGNGGEGLYRRGIQIESDVPIVAYAHTFGQTNSGATMLMPVETWGYSYISVNSRQRYANNCFSWAYAIANHDNTVVEITPSVETRNGRTPGVPFTVTLNKGEVYQVIGANPTGGADALEMSGTKFKSIANASGQCYPIAVFSGSSRTSNPISCGSGGGDNDNQQLFPTQAWGKRYLTAPTSRDAAPNQFMMNSYKILVKDPDTEVRRNGTVIPQGQLTNNHYFFESNTADYITADKPIMVAQFMTGGTGCAGSLIGDPEMIYLSPLEQGIKRIGFYRNNAQSIITNYLTLIVPSGGTGLSSLRIDGMPLTSVPAPLRHSYPHPRLPGYTVVVRKWSGFAAYPSLAPGQCIVSSDSAFTAITYGLGSQESYGYNAGTMINNLSAISSIQNTLDPSVSEHEFTCTNTPVKLSALMAYPPTHMEWLLSTLGSDITPATDVIDNAPVSTGTVVINGITYYKYTLPGTYIFNRADTFEIPIRTTHPSVERCDHTEDLKIRVIVKDKPRADFTFAHTGCTLDTIQFNGVSATSDGYTLNAWNWTLPGGIAATGQDIKQVLPPGTHDVLLSVVTAEGCASDTTKPVVVHDKPLTSFAANPISVCEGSSISFTPSSSYTNPGELNEWYWDFGNGTTATAGSDGPQSYVYPDPGVYTVKQVAKAGQLCISDTAVQTVTIYAKPTLSFTYPIGCLPVGDIAQFNGSATTSDGQTIASHHWNFGDPNATPGNPNTSTDQNPTHVYTTYGTYAISYGAITVNGCRRDSVLDVTFDVRPQLDFTALNDVCENEGVVAFTNGSVTNGVPGTFVYKGPGTEEDGSFHPEIAGPGTHTIWYVFTSSAGCMDSLSRPITVHAKPHAAYTFPAGCTGTDGVLQFTNTSTIADAQTLSYVWNFNDPNAGAGNPNTSTQPSPSHIFAEGEYDVLLQVTSSNGCIKDTSVSISIGVTPALTFYPLAALCQDPGATPVSVAQASVTNGVNGTGVYSGLGTTTDGQFDPNVAGHGIHTITYTFTSTNGCQQIITQTIEVYPRPQSSFTISDASSCFGDDITIASTATIPAGTIANWNWNLGDGRTPSYNNADPFVINYPAANDYVISLVTVSDRGCTSETVTGNLSVHPLPVADFTLPAGICMPGGQAQFTNTSTVPDNSNLSYLWNFGDGSGTSTAVSPTYVYATAGTYPVTLTATSAFGCTDVSDSKLLSDFFDKPVARFQVSPQELCEGENTLFIDGSSAPNSSLSSWKWNFGDGSNSTAQTPVKQFPNAGDYTVELTVTNAIGCESDPFRQDVKVHLQPKIDAGRSFTVAQGSTVQFDATANSQGLSFQWTPAANLDNPTALRPTLTAMQDQRYVLTATGDFGCTASDYIDVRILRPVKVPNVFSPNGDGIHDKWAITNLVDYEGCKVEVFNRYGQLVFASTGYGVPWDGRHNGKDLPVGAYYYVIVLENGFKPLTGSLTIVR